MGNQFKAFIGIDPGKHGAMAFYTPGNKQIKVYDFTDLSSMDGYIKDCLFVTADIMATIEQVHAFPGQGVSGMFNFGMNYGGWQGLLIANQIPYGAVSPQRWQKEMLEKSDGKNTKDRSRVMASRLFPDYSELFKRKKDADRADAVLIAVYASRIYKGLKDIRLNLIAKKTNRKEENR